MLKKIMLMCIVIMLVNLALVPSLLAADNNSRDDEIISKLRTNIQSQGTGPDSKIKVELADGTKSEGYIFGISGNGFVVIDKTSGQKIAIDYSQVKHAQGSHWSARKSIFYGAIIGLAVIAVVIVAALNNDK